MSTQQWFYESNYIYDRAILLGLFRLAIFHRLEVVMIAVYTPWDMRRDNNTAFFLLNSIKPNNH